MAIFRMGPDGLLFAQALIVSVVVALLAWRQVGLTAGISAMAVLTIALVVWQATRPDMATGLNHQFVAASMIVVPSALLLGASRLRWLARYAWAFLLIGPVFFAGCYVGICEVCVKSGLI